MAQERRQLAAAEVLGTTLNQQHVKEEDRLSLLMPFSQERGRNFLELPTAFPYTSHWTTLDQMPILEAIRGRKMAIS